MANLSEDIQCAGSDTRPPMLDRTDFVSWQQRIRLYCRGAQQLGLERARVYSDLSPEDKDRMQLNSKFVNNMLPEWGRFVTAVKLNRGLRDSNYDQLYAYLKQYEAHANENKMILDRFTQHVNRGQGNNSQGAGAAGYGGAQNRVGNANLVDDCDAFDSDVDEAPTAQTMFMENLSSADPVYDQASSSYDSDILYEVPDHDNYQDAICEHHEVHEIHDDVQPNYIVDSHVDDTGDSNMISYDQYVKDNAAPVVQSNESSNNVGDNSLTAELATYKEQVELYKRRAKFELTEREQKITEQLRIVIVDRNHKEEKLKRELHSVKLQLTSTINYNKSMVEEVATLKKDFKQKENKYLEKFLDMKAFKEKVEDKLYKQDQSLQTVHMLCKPKPYYDEQNKVAIGYKNPLCLTRAQQVQPALYNGHEIIKTTHVPAIVHNSEDILEIAEITRNKMNDKMKDPECEKEAEVDQNVVNRKHDKIKRKNLLIANDNLIADCLSKEVFYIATNSELIVSRFTKMHDVHTVVQACCLTLEVELSKLKDKIQQDDHNELVKCFSNLKQLLPSNLIYLYVCPAVRFTYADSMADMNIPANDVPAEQAPAIAPPTRTDDQILPIHRWVPIGKSNYVLDVLKLQRNPIFKMVVAILKNTNFFRAFTASSTIPAIYIQQFWDTMRYDSTTGIYSCQVDEQWFNLHKDILRDALQITPINDDNPFVAPPSSDAVIEYVNTLGYPCTLRNVSAMSVNDLYQPWRAILSMINMCLIGKTAGHDRPRHHVLQILWGIIHRSNIDYAERIWEEFVQSIQTFLTEKKRLTMTLRKKKKSAPLLIPSIRFTKLIIHHLNTKHNIHPRTGSPLHYSHDDNVLGNLRFVGKDGREVFGMPIPDALLTDAIKRTPYYGRYLAHVAEYQQHLDGEHSMAEEGAVQGKGKEKVIEEQDARDLLTLQTLKKQSPADQFIFQRCTPTTTEPSGNAKSPSLDAELAIVDREMEFDEEVTPVNKEKDASNKVILEEPTSSTGTLSSLQHLEKELRFTDQFFVEKPQEEEPEKTNAESEVESMKVSKAVDEIVTDTVDWALQAPLRARFRDLLEADMKEILLQLMWETGSYKTHEDYKNLYEALEKSMDRDHLDQLQADLAKARKKRRKRSDSPRTPFGSPPPPPPPPPPPTCASGAPDNLINDDSIPDEQTIPSSNVSDVENNWASALVSTNETPVENSLLAKTRDMTTFMNRSRWRSVTRCLQIRLTRRIRKGSRPALSISKMKAARYPDFGLELLVPEQMWIDEVCTYDISATYGISHWWFNRQKFYIERHDSPSHRREVRKHMRILSVIRIKAYSRYGDFEDLNLLLLQGHLDHLSGSDKRYDTKGFEFKHDYTIIKSPRAVVFPVNNNERKIIRFNEIYKFSDGTLTNILEALDYRVKEYKVNRFNPVDIEKVAVRSSLRSLKPKCTIESRAKRSSINLIRTLFHITCSSHNVKTRVIIRVLRIILVVLPEHPSDTYVFTIKMEILLEPTSNKLMVGDFDVHTLEDPTLRLEILSRRFFLRLNLPDHRSVFTGSGVNMDMEIPHSSGVYFITACSYSTDTSNDLVKAQVYVSKLPQL
ncbi:hypothetical protein Tco_0531859 [Tanacetum coccineum]